MSPDILSRLFYTLGLVIEVIGLSFIIWEISKRNAQGKANLMKAGLVLLIAGHILKFLSCWNSWV